MLQNMERTGPASTSREDTADFAGILAALTQPAPKPKPAWDDTELAADVASLSYESALKARARYLREQGTPWAATENQPVTASDPDEIWDDEPLMPGSMPAAAIDSDTKPQHASPVAVPQSRKCASITVRMSRAECDQLRQRAAEAGMTISAYLRSCTFEAESLRAQVKQALAEMKQASTVAKPVKSVEAPQERGTRSSWLRRLVPGRPVPPRAA